jgi:hypothetical protein
MVLAFKAVQNLDLPVLEQPNKLPLYLRQEARVVGALLNSDQLTCLDSGGYRYAVRPLQLFQLRIKPVVELKAQQGPGLLSLNSVSCDLEGIPGITDDFQLNLRSWLQAESNGLVGEAELSVEVSHPPVLRLIPARALEATGESLLNGILLSIKGRVGKQLVSDFQSWCLEQN